MIGLKIRNQQVVRSIRIAGSNVCNDLQRFVENLISKAVVTFAPFSSPVAAQETEEQRLEKALLTLRRKLIRRQWLRFRLL